LRCCARLQAHSHSVYSNKVTGEQRGEVAA
jgi:hypothetical protein